MQLCFIAQNLLYGGIQDDAGNQDDRWPLLLKRIAGVQPDFVLLSEVLGWDKQGHRQLARAIHDLELEALPLAPSNSGGHVALFYRPETVGQWRRWDPAYAWDTTHGFGIGAFDVGLPQDLSVIPVHLDPWRKEKALSEIGLIASRGYRWGSFTVIGGDLNYPPAHGLKPDCSKMRPFNMASRTVHTDRHKSEKPQPYRGIGLALENAGYVDVAYHLYEQIKDKTLLRHTGSTDRIDQFWVTKALAPAITSYRVIDDPPNASDHKAICFRLETDQVDSSTSIAWHSADSQRARTH